MVNFENPTTLKTGEVKEIVMFSIVIVNRSDIPICNSFWPILGFIEIFQESLNKTPTPKPEKIFSLKDKKV